MKKNLIVFLSTYMIIAGLKVNAQDKNSEFWQIADIISEFVFTENNNSCFELRNAIMKVNKSHYGWSCYEHKKYAYLDYKRVVSFSDAKFFFNKLKSEFKNFRQSWEFVDDMGDFSCSLFSNINPGYSIHMRVEKSVVEDFELTITFEK